MDSIHAKDRTGASGAATWRLVGLAIALSFALGLFGAASFTGSAHAAYEADSDLFYANPELRFLQQYNDGVRDEQPPPCAGSGGVCSPSMIGNDYWDKPILMA